jgi:hypothetical protein
LRTLRLQRPAVAESLRPHPPVEAKRRLPPREEWFPFTVEVVSSLKALRAAVKVRQAAYSRHLPEFADSLLHALQQDLEYLVVTARAPIDRQYQRLLFSEVYPGLGMVPLRHVANLPHRVMKFELLTAEKRCADAGHPMLDFMCNTLHPEIHIPQNR